MSGPHLSQELLRPARSLHAAQDLRSAARELIDARLPALPVVDADERYAGIFGEREFIAALFPGYLGELHYAAFVPDTLDDALERRSQSAAEPVSRYMNTEHVDASPHCSDAQLAETFLHHRVLIVPIVDRGEVRGLVTRWDFFKAVSERLQS
jgi:CBS domain-containing protein